MTSSTAIHTVQGQLDAYNRRDLEKFMIFYSQDIEVFDFPNNQSRIKGIDAVRESYKKLFEENPKLHCNLVNRIVQGAVVIDQELVTGFEGKPNLNAIAIYRLENNLIREVHFIK